MADKQHSTDPTIVPHYTVVGANIVTSAEYRRQVREIGRELSRQQPRRPLRRRLASAWRELRR